ncbi:MAG: ATP synthase F1 subunit delta [Alphaproteobacteria bacterium]
MVISTVNAGLLTSLPGRYAKALFQVGLADQQTEQLREEFKSLVLLYAQEDDLLQKTLQNDFLSKVQRIAIWRAVAKALSLAETLQRFIIVLLEAGRLPLLLPIATIYEALVDDAAGIIRADVQSAKPLSQQQQQHLETILTKRYAAKVEATYTLEPTLLGGVYIQCGSEVIDATLKGQLTHLVHNIEGEA